MGQKALQLVLQRTGVSQPQLMSLLNMGGANQYLEYISSTRTLPSIYDTTNTQCYSTHHHHTASTPAI